MSKIDLTDMELLFIFKLVSDLHYNVYKEISEMEEGPFSEYLVNLKIFKDTERLLDKILEVVKEIKDEEQEFIDNLPENL